MSGFDLCERLPLIESAYQLFFITIHDNAETRERVRQSWVVAFLAKPFGDQALLDLIRRKACPT